MNRPIRPKRPLSPAAAALLDYIRRRDHVTYAEMPRCLEPLGIPTKGTLALELVTCPNLILWNGMSREWVDIMHELFSAGLVRQVSTVLLTYLCDGACLTLPIAKRPPKHGYSKPHWAPTVLRPASPR